MFFATASRSVNEFTWQATNQLMDELTKIAGTINSVFGIVVYDFSHVSGSLVKIAEVHPMDNGNYLSDLERSVPALSCKAKRLFEQAEREGRVGISPVDLSGNCSFVTIVTPDNLMLFGVKSDDLILNHQVIESTVDAVVKIRESIPSLRRERLKVVEFKRPTTSQNRPLAAL